jgi:exopolyphosphatase/guanosine-5'-triphosphate,3'-diphosphate pyrophosphatase
LWSRPNVGFPRGLRAVVDDGVHRYAVVDVGTNSVRIVLGEVAAEGRWQTIVDRAEITRLDEDPSESVTRPGPGRADDRRDRGMADEARQMALRAELVTDGAYRDRTGDLLRARQALSQLS